MSVYVDHGVGIGRILYEALLERMRQAGMRLVVGAATMPNDASARLHRTLGFEVVGRFARSGSHRAGGAM